MTLSRFNLSSSQIPMEADGSSSALTLTKRNSSFPSTKNNLLLISSQKQSSSFSSSGGKISNFDLSAPLSSYTSLKDLMPLSPQSPCSAACFHSTFHDIPIKNPLVKHAAWAYLRPKLSSIGSNDRRYGFKRVWITFVKKPVDACLAFVARAFDRFLGAIGFRGTRRW